MEKTTIKPPVIWADPETTTGELHLYNDGIESISWQNVGVSVTQKDSENVKHLLRSVSGNAGAGSRLHPIDWQDMLTLSSGDMVALMGPSGSGKTTLLNVLARRTFNATASLEGGVCINCVPASSTTVRQSSRYVEQEDYLIGSLTVRETLDFAAKLGLPRY